MLHELLFALSGHPSPLLSEDEDLSQFKTVLTPSEETLLRSIARLGLLHAEIRTHATTASSSHPSVICRAVAVAILSVHLNRFQEKILAVEKGILQDDASFVGAYDIVPLSSIAGAFSGWTPILQWLKDLVQYMEQLSASDAAGGSNAAIRSASGAQLIDHLRAETRTGYPDIEQIANELTRDAESAWLRQVSGWVLYGCLPKLGGEDFFVGQRQSIPGQEIPDYYIRGHLVPKFVTRSTANSILFIGKSLDHIKSQGSKTFTSSLSLSHLYDFTLLSSHLEDFSSLKYPISSPGLSMVIARIRQSLSQHALQKLLPLSVVLQILDVLRNFFLLQRGEFAIGLIGAADEHLMERHGRSAADTRQEETHRLGGMMIKESEVATVLARAWSAMAALTDDDDTDEELDLARDLIRLSIKKHGSTGQSASFPLSLGFLQSRKEVQDNFDDALLGTPTAISMVISPPINLFLDPIEIDGYSAIHTYLLSIRRAHLHLTQLWKLSVLRRVHPLPERAAGVNGEDERLRRVRERGSQRHRLMRSTWALVASATLFLTELGEYLQGEVVASSWKEFHRWLNPSTPILTPAVPPGPVDIAEGYAEHGHPHDPESLAIAHRAYLGALVHALLLNDTPFTKLLRAFLNKIDHMVALMRRMSVVHQNVEAEEERDAMVATSRMAMEEDELIQNLAGARLSVRSDLYGLVSRLRAIDADPRGREESFADDSVTTGFVPFRSAGVHRLLMKLDFASFHDREGS